MFWIIMIVFSTKVYLVLIRFGFGRYSNKLSIVKLGYNKLGYNKHPVIMNKTNMIVWFQKKQFLQDFLFIAKFYKNFKSVFMGFAFWGDGSIPNDSKERSFFSLILQNPKMVVLNRERQFKPSHQLICCSHKKD